MSQRHLFKINFLVTDDYGKMYLLVITASSSVINRSMPKIRLQADEIQLWKCWRDAAFPK